VANPTLSVPILRPARQFDQPVQDEWGIFDPQQAGVEALIRKLQFPTDKDGAHEAVPPTQK